MTTAAETKQDRVAFSWFVRLVVIYGIILIMVATISFQSFVNSKTFEEVVRIMIFIQGSIVVITGIYALVTIKGKVDDFSNLPGPMAFLMFNIFALCTAATMIPHYFPDDPSHIP